MQINLDVPQYVDFIMNSMKDHFYEIVVKYNEMVVPIDSYIYELSPDLGTDLKIHAVNEACKMLKKRGYRQINTGYGGLRQGWWIEFEKFIID